MITYFVSRTVVGIGNRDVKKTVTALRKLMFWEERLAMMKKGI